MQVAMIIGARRHIMHSFRAKSTEWLATIAAMLIGYSLSLPESTFALSQSYNQIAALVFGVGLSEEAFGWCVMVLAMIRFAVLAYNGLWTNSPIARMVMSSVYAVVWFLIAYGFYMQSGWASLGTSLIVTLVIGELINALRTSTEAGRVRFLVKGRESHDATARN